MAALAGAAVVGAALVEQFRRPPRRRDWHGAIGPVPYDFRPPTLDRLRRNWWSPDDPRLLTPITFGAGWSVNVGRLVRR